MSETNITAFNKMIIL